MKSRVSRATVAIVAVALLLVAASPVQAEWNKGLEAYKNKDWATAVTEFEEVSTVANDQTIIMGICNVIAKHFQKGDASFHALS